jgi:hypothetical protein
MGEVASQAEILIVNKATQDQLTVKTDNQGIFNTRLDAGEYEIYQTSQKGKVLLASVSLEEAETRKLNLRIPPQEETSLAAIQEYEVGLSETATVGSQTLSDLINPFPARKRGRFYGSLYEFHRNDNVDARNFFDPVGRPLPEYKRNQFGLSMGAFATETLTIQGSYEGLRIIQGSTLLSHIPTPEMKEGDFSGLDQEIVDPATGEPFLNNRIPEERISPVAKNLLSALPDPNRSDPDRNFVNNDPTVYNSDSLLFKVDYEFQEDSKLHFNYDLRDVNSARVHSLPLFNSSSEERYQSGSLAFNQALSARLITNVRLGVDRGSALAASRNSGSEGLLKSLGIPGVGVEDAVEEGFPDFRLSGYAGFGDNNSPNTWVRNSLYLDAAFTYALNNHSLRAGFEVWGRQLNNYRSDGLHRGRFIFNGFYTGDSFADLLLGLPSSAYRGIGSDRVDLRRKEWEVSLSDQWKLTPDFDVSFGVRYEYTPPLHSIRDNVSGFYPLLFEPPLDGEIIVAPLRYEVPLDNPDREAIIAASERASELGFDAATSGSLIFPDRDNWAPQLGFAYNLLGANQLVLRGSHIVVYDSPSEWYFIRSLSRNTPFYYREGVEAPPTDPFIDLSNPFEAQAVPELTINGIEPDIKDAMVQYWQLELQNQIARHWHLRARYRGRKGTHMTRLIPGNVPLPGPEAIQPRRPNPDYGRFLIATHGGIYEGHSLTLSAERRLSKGFTFNSWFDWRRTFDDNVYGNPSNPRNLRAERAIVRWTPQKSFYLNYILDVPIGRGGFFGDVPSWSQWVLDGWRFSGITHIRAGRTFTVGMSGDPNNDGVSGDRPDRLGPGNLDPSERSIDRWFNTEDFSKPEQYGFGNAGRNILLAPGYHAWDVSVIKQTRLSDGDFLELRVEFFNAFNQVNFQRPEADFGTSLFGKIFGAERAREIQIGAKYSF